MKKIYIAVTIEENGKYYSYTMPIATGMNIISKLDGIRNAKVLHLCESKRKADELTTFWNNSYKANGTYLFDNTKL